MDIMFDSEPTNSDLEERLLSCEQELTQKVERIDMLEEQIANLEDDNNDLKKDIAALESKLDEYLDAAKTAMSNLADIS